MSGTVCLVFFNIKLTAIYIHFSYDCFTVITQQCNNSNKINTDSAAFADSQTFESPFAFIVRYIHSSCLCT